MEYLLLVVVFLFIAYVLKAKKKSISGKSFKAERKVPLTEREQDMYKVLKAAFEEPTFSVLSQVSMQALITTPRGDKSMRNRYDRKYVDFVICSPSFFVLAVIELDDRTHNSKTGKDAERDAMLRSAGIETLRYRKIPTPEQVKQDVLSVVRT